MLQFGDDKHSYDQRFLRKGVSTWERTRLMTGDNRKAASRDVLVLVQHPPAGGYAYRTGQGPASTSLPASSLFAGGQRPATTMIPPDLLLLSILDSPKNESQPIVPAVRGGSLTLRERAVANRASPYLTIPIPPLDGWEEHDWLKTFKRCRVPAAGAGKSRNATAANSTEQRRGGAGTSDAGRWLQLQQSPQKRGKHQGIGHPLPMKEYGLRDAATPGGRKTIQ
ncbi:hypothetical protein CPLU01_15459 [Colletotrichum plurivorum]|uniref:Uncharacterized protein n=1 Tax=Colletotrichum plurivorum TaxID=2175906 RepID=A0A8H6JAU1_9PEZI|nr:hypothetical protein CPLU01_15459 [Colletotrichum plurivorum]